MIYYFIQVVEVLGAPGVCPANLHQVHLWQEQEELQHASSAPLHRRQGLHQAHRRFYPGRLHWTNQDHSQGSGGNLVCFFRMQGGVSCLIQLVIISDLIYKKQWSIMGASHDPRHVKPQTPQTPDTSNPRHIKPKTHQTSDNKTLYTSNP